MHNNQSVILRCVSQNVVQCLLTAFTEENKVADMIKTQNVNIKKQQEDVKELLDKIVAAIELSCGGRQAREVSSVYNQDLWRFKSTVAK